MGHVGGQSKCTRRLRTKPETWKPNKPLMKRQILSCILNKTDDVVLYGLLAALHLGHVWKEGVCFLLQQNKPQGLLGLRDNNLHNFTCLSDKNWYVKESLRQHRIPGHSFDQKHARLRIIVKGIVYSKNYIYSHSCRYKPVWVPRNTKLEILQNVEVFFPPCNYNE